VNGITWEGAVGAFILAAMLAGAGALIYGGLLARMVTRPRPPEERCGDEAPPHGTGYDSRPRGLLCTRKRDHRGYHVARDYSTGRLWSWSNL